MILVKHKPTGQTGKAFNVNGADRDSVDWLSDNERLSIQDRIRISKIDDMEVILHRIAFNLRYAIIVGRVKINYDNGELTE